jgi:mannosyltransferase
MKQGRISRIEISICALILLLALALRFYRLDGQSLWADEGASVVQAGRSLADIAAHTARDIHPPLYYYLLHFWVQFLGNGEIAVRSLSALLGVLLVGLIFLLGRRLADTTTGLAAAFVAALSPFQVYYSQEARMYMLLAVLGAAAAYAALRYVEEERQGFPQGWAAIYVAAAAGGLYTHYAFPAVLAAVNLAYLAPAPLQVASAWRDGPGWRRLGRWLLLQCGALLLFAPWLPTAYRQLTSWPAPAQPVPPEIALKTPLQLLSLGLSLAGPGAEVLAFGFALLALIGLLAPPLEKGPGSTFYRLLLPLYLLLPVLLTVALFKPAYLKFLLAASPAFCLAVGQGLTLPFRLAKSPSLRKSDALLTALAAGWLGLGLLFVGGVSALSLRNYYFDPRYARDDYRGIARYVEAAGREGDAVILNAPGQEEIFGYYYKGQLPIYPLPRQRPPDEAQTVAELEEIAKGHERIFALFWATAESDPQGLVEGWLDRRAYKAWDAWHGNVRLAIYATLARGKPAVEETLDARLGSAIVLQGYRLYGDKVVAGDILQVTLLWKAEEIPAANYKVFVHVVDGQGRVTAQRDSEPLAGERPTTSWQPGEVIEDNYGILIPPGTPPGSYRLLAGMYDPADGARLPVSLGERGGLDYVPLGELEVGASNLPVLNPVGDDDG